MQSLKKIKLILTLCLLAPALLMAGDYNEQALKTLFTSQQQRQDIESNRRDNSTSGEPLPVGLSSVQINGIVKRSGGKNIVWINGKSTLENTMVDGVKVYPNAINTKNKIPVMIDGERVYIKPGQIWSEETGVSDVNN